MHFILLLLLCLFVAQTSVAQTNINTFNAPRAIVDNHSTKDGIKATPYHIDITTKVIYNAPPDGYYITFTKSFISKSVEEVETMMNQTTDQVIAKVKNLNRHYHDWSCMEVSEQIFLIGEINTQNHSHSYEFEYL